MAMRPAPVLIRVAAPPRTLSASWTETARSLSEVVSAISKVVEPPTVPRWMPFVVVDAVPTMVLPVVPETVTVPLNASACTSWTLPVPVWMTAPFLRVMSPIELK